MNQTWLQADQEAAEKKADTIGVAIDYVNAIMPILEVGATRVARDFVRVLDSEQKRYQEIARRAERAA